MPFIHVLDEATINQIAAGEVVERPSALVKELIENAMDAGATAITAEIKEGGLSFIRITDNGSGIAKEDIPLAFLRHATSKIRTAEDLLSVTSLGFRGEALSSIASVAQVELITKTPTALNGFRYLIEGGEEKSLEEIGCPGGTTIIVRNIFYNTPARRKFLKSAMTEAGYISDLMERLIVSHPYVSFKFIVNNQVKLQSSGNNNSKDILYHIYGRDISKELLPLDHQSEDVKVTGYIGKPIITRGNRNFENYFINGRYIKSNVITKAIEEAYKPFLMQHKYPFTSIYFEIDPSMIDVNVHPQKMEIRLKNSEEIYQLTYQLIRSTLAGKELIPKVHLTHEQEMKKETDYIPEPFEVNRRKQFEEKSNNTNKSFPASNIFRESTGPVTTSNKDKIQSFQYGKAYDHGMNKVLDKVSDKGTDYIKATEPLITSTSPIADTLTGVLKAAAYSFKQEKDHNNDQPLTKDSELIKINNPKFHIDDSYIENKVPGSDQNSDQNINRNLDHNNYQCNAINSDQINLSGNEENQNNKENQHNENTINHINDGSITGVYLEGTEIICKEDDDQKGLGIDTQTLNPTMNSANSQKDSTEEPAVILKDPKKISSEQMSLFIADPVSENTPFLSQKAAQEHKIIGQIFSTYWLVEYKKELYIIDQHAAHEKVLYEKIMSSAKSKTYESQQLLPPIVLTLTLREQEILQKHEEVLNSLGYEFEHFGGKEYSVRAVPADLYNISEKELLLEFIDGLADEIPGTAVSSNSILERAASLSCKAAVKANHTLSYEEAAALINELLTLENPYHCPHGRPVIVSMSQYELERKFKRIL